MRIREAELRDATAMARVSYESHRIFIFFMTTSFSMAIQWPHLASMIRTSTTFST